MPIFVFQSYNCFAFQGQVFQFRVVPFGLSLPPRIFTRVVAATLAPFQLRWIRILPYLDDWMNWKKSSLRPKQQVNFLGLHLNSMTMQVCLTPRRTDNLEKAINNVQKGKIVTAHRVKKLLGMIAAASIVIP